MTYKSWKNCRSISYCHFAVLWHFPKQLAFTIEWYSLSLKVCGDGVWVWELQMCGTSSWWSLHASLVCPLEKLTLLAPLLTTSKEEATLQVDSGIVSHYILLTRFYTLYHILTIIMIIYNTSGIASISQQRNIARVYQYLIAFLLPIYDKKNYAPLVQTKTY